MDSYEIDIITLSCARNYGAMLQTYALYKYLCDQGHKVKVIDYITERYNLEAPNYVERAIGKHKLFGKNRLTKILWRQSYYKADIKARQVFRKFLKNNVNLTQTYYNNNDLRSVSADIFITGSDQIWNTDFSWDKNIDLPYFLDFVSDHSIKISYSSSFGKTELKDTEKDAIYQHLRRFHKLGVREMSGRQILSDMGLESTVVCDPTLLLSAERWSSLAKLPKVREKYVLLFQIKPNKDFIRFANRFSKEVGYKLVILCPDLMHKIKVRNGVFLPEVEEWIGYIYKASYILTDSFHATVFSTIFKKQFYSASFAGYNSRIIGYLKEIGMENRGLSLDDVKNYKCDFELIDYQVAEKKIETFIDQSKKWLLNALSLKEMQ